MTLRIMVSRHSAFYSPLICTLARGYLKERGLEAGYSVLGRGQRSHQLLREGAVDVMQSAVSSNWKPAEQGERVLPVHFAQINRRDGFFLVGRRPDPAFEWRKLEGAALLADHGLQPLVMLKYAIRHNGADWSRIRSIDAGAPEEMIEAFRAGTGDYIQLQAPAPDQLERNGEGAALAAVGASMPPVAFSSLCASREFLRTAAYGEFIRAYAEARRWVRESPPEEVAAAEASYFPGVDVGSLAAAVRRYQVLGCWDGGVDIPRDLYEQALNVFESAGEIRRRPPYDEVCAPSGIE